MAEQQLVEGDQLELQEETVVEEGYKKWGAEVLVHCLMHKYFF